MNYGLLGSPEFSTFYVTGVIYIGRVSLALFLSPGLWARGFPLARAQLRPRPLWWGMERKGNTTKAKTP